MNCFISICFYLKYLESVGQSADFLLGAEDERLGFSGVGALHNEIAAGLQKRLLNTNTDTDTDTPIKFNFNPDK